MGDDKYYVQTTLTEKTGNITAAGTEETKTHVAYKGTVSLEKYIEHQLEASKRGHPDFNLVKFKWNLYSLTNADIAEIKNPFLRAKTEKLHTDAIKAVTSGRRWMALGIVISLLATGAALGVIFGLHGAPLVIGIAGVAASQIVIPFLPLVTALPLVGGLFGSISLLTGLLNRSFANRRFEKSVYAAYTPNKINNALMQPQSQQTTGVRLGDTTNPAMTPQQQRMQQQQRLGVNTGDMTRSANPIFGKEMGGASPDNRRKQ